MKKTLVALSVAAFAAASANAAVVYNQDGTKLEVSGSVRVVLDKVTDHRLDLNNDGSRVKFAFSQDLGEGLSALGYIELRPSDDDFGGGITTKKLYAGLAHADIGTLTFGKQATAFDGFKLADPTEQGLSVFGREGLHSSTVVNTDGAKAVRFASKDFNGFGFETSYTFAQNSAKEDSKGDKTVNDREYQLLAKYEQDYDGVGVKAHAIYGQRTLTEEVKQKTYGLAAGVDYAGFGFAVDYAQTKAAEYKVKAFELAATYQVSEPVDVYATYTHIKGTKSGEELATVKGITLGTHYQVAKNVQTYVEYDSVKEKNMDRENGVFAGLRVFF